MIAKILHNKYVKKTCLTNVKISKSKEFFIWEFEGEGDKFVGFSPINVYYGSKTYIWYSLLAGYFLPPSYNVDFDNIIGKECIVTVDAQKKVRSLIPLNTKIKNADTVPEVAETIQQGDANDQAKDLFS